MALNALHALILCIDSVDIASTFLAHNFLDIQPIFNLFKVVESSESGLFNCIDSIDMDSIECIILCIECHNLYGQF